MQDNITGGLVIADGNGVMPFRVPEKTQINQHDDWVVCRKFRQQNIHACKRIGDSAMSPHRADQRGLEAAFQARCIDLMDKIIRGDRQATPAQGHSQSGRAALELFLGKEGNRSNMYLVRRGIGPGGRGAERQYPATGKGQQVNDEQHAGGFPAAGMPNPGHSVLSAVIDKGKDVGQPCDVGNEQDDKDKECGPD